MRVFVTGATGFIGSAVIRELIHAGHRPVGLARSRQSADRLQAMGAEPHSGSLEDADSLRSAASATDGVIHLAFMHQLSSVPWAARLQIFLGGMPSGIVGRFLAITAKADRQAIDALGSALQGSGRPLVTTFGTIALASQRASGSIATEDDQPDPESPGAGRALTEHNVSEWSTRGVRGSIVRLAPTVHGDGDRSGFIPNLIKTAQKRQFAGYVGDGSNRWPAVHRDDAARLFRLALESGTSGAVYHGAAEQGVSFREITQAIGQGVGVHSGTIPDELAAKHFGWLGPLVGIDNPVCSQKTREELGWVPEGPELIADLQISYFKDRAWPA